jgi:phage terminase large subunit GpA-like protein
MSRRGEVTVECDVKGCGAEQHFTVKHLDGTTFNQAKYAAGWRWWNYHDVCPQCEEEQVKETALDGKP